MSDILHPNLLKILDADPDAKWFVSQFHPNGTLVENQHQFVGNFSKALRAFRPLVEGVSELHKHGRVHRDIKPQNVFFDAADNLILGDFGLVFFTDADHTRLSGFP
jgi:serine/threonine protein kinase